MFSFADRGHINNGFSGNIIQDTDRNSKDEGSLRHRNAHQNIHPGSQRINQFYHAVSHKMPDQDIDSPRETPLVFSVENFEDSSESSRSNPESPRSDKLSDRNHLNVLTQSNVQDSADIHL